LSAALGYPVDARVFAQRLDRILAREGDVVLVATDANTVVGWIHGAEHEYLETGPLCEILGLIVDAATRRRGAGHQLVSAVEAWAAARELPEVAVRSNILRVESHPFYEGLGFVRVKTQHAYRKPLARL
jgi:N-acetylglutamate synthase-like GNAT family acetyltransferase